MFCERLEKICKENNIAPCAVLKKLGLSSGNLKRWKCGGSPSAQTLSALSNYFDVPVEFFLAESGGCDIECEYKAEYKAVPSLDDERASKKYCLIFNFDEAVTVEEATQGINNLIKAYGGRVLKEWVKMGEPYTKRF